MAEGEGLENQEVQTVDKPPIAEDKKSPSLPVPPEKELQKPPEANVNLDNDPNVIEHVDRVKVETMVRKIGEFYDVPQEAIEQGLRSEIYILNDAGFRRHANNYIEQLIRREGKGEIETISTDDEIAKVFYSANGSSIEEENRNRAFMNQLIVQKAREHADEMGGSTIPLDNGKSVIIIKEGSSIDRETLEVHELIHAMSIGKDGKIGGFRSGEKTGPHRNIDEAATQVLALAFQHPELTPKDFLLSEIKTPYASHVRKLLTAMFTTSQSGNPFTFKELAEYYFYQEPGMGVILLQMNLIPRAREDVRAQVQEWFSNDFKEKQSR